MKLIKQDTKQQVKQKIKLFMLLCVFLFSVVSCKNQEPHISFCQQTIKQNERQVICAGKQIKSLEPLKALTDLKILDLTGSKVTDFLALKELLGLETLILNSTNFKNISLLKPLKKLEILELKNTKIKKLNFIEEFQKLKFLSIKETKAKGEHLLNLFLKRKCVYLELDTFYLTQSFFKENFKHKKRKQDGHITYKSRYQSQVITDKKTLKNYTIQGDYIDFVDVYQSPDLMLSRYDKELEELHALTNMKGEFLKFSNIQALLRLKQLKRLKIYLINDKHIDVLSKLKGLEELHLILSDQVKKIPKLPNSLKRLFVYKKEIKHFDFLDPLNLEHVEFYVKDHKKAHYLKAMRKYSKFDLLIKDFYLNSNFSLFYQHNREFDEEDPYAPHFNAFKHISFPSFDHYKVDFAMYSYQRYLRKLIQNKEYCELLLTENIAYTKYLIQKYLHLMNNLNDEQETVLDCVLSENEIDVAKLLKKAGAKRGCELLKTKCDKL